MNWHNRYLPPRANTLKGDNRIMNPALFRAMYDWLVKMPPKERNMVLGSMSNEHARAFREKLAEVQQKRTREVRIHPKAPKTIWRPGMKMD